MDLLTLGEGRSDYGDGVDYSFARAAEDLASDASRADIETFLEERPHIEKDAKFLVACSRTMLGRGEQAFSDELFAKAEKAAFSGHWSMYLGGQKLELQDLRIEREGTYFSLFNNFSKIPQTCNHIRGRLGQFVNFIK